MTLCHGLRTNITFLFFLSFVIILLLLTLSADSRGEEESGGSDENITLDANPGGSGDFGWNVTHGFVIKEHQSKVDEEFTIVMCEEIKYNNTLKKHEPAGYIFGELRDIRWDDDPPPFIRLSEEDFHEFKHDESNVSIYVYGEYEEDKPGDSEYRYAFFLLTISKPNHEPVAVARMALPATWNWSIVNETNVTRFFVESVDPMELWFNGSHSWDVDLDPITDWKWDLDGDGKFGYTYPERGMNISASFSHSRRYELGLMVIDKRGKVSNIRNFTIEIILKAETGGTDGNIRLAAIAGQSSGYAWNELHDFVIREKGERIDERFNVTLCKDLQWDDGDWSPDGHIFGEIRSMHWQDDPTPMLRISDWDFLEYSDDTFNLTLYAYASYHHPENGYRYAYKRFVLQRPNNPPIAVARIRVAGNDSNITILNMNSYYFQIDPLVPLHVTFDGNGSWDPDGEPVIHWMWALSDYGEFGAHESERFMVAHGNYSVGIHHLGLRVGDGKENSTELHFTLKVQEIPLKPNLHLQHIVVRDEEGTEKSLFNKGERINFDLRVTNTGRNQTYEPVDILVESRESSLVPFEYLAGTRISPPLYPFDSTDETLVWDTGLANTVLGQHQIRIIIDPVNTIDEENETDNVQEFFIRIGDLTPPLIIVTSHHNNTTVNGTIFITGSISDNVGIEQFQYRPTDGSSWTDIAVRESWTLELNTTRLPDGSYSLEFRAWDGTQYSESTYIHIIIRNDSGSSDPAVPAYLIVFLISLVLVVIALVAFSRDKGNLSRKGLF